MKQNKIEEAEKVDRSVYQLWCSVRAKFQLSILRSFDLNAKERRSQNMMAKERKHDGDNAKDRKHDGEGAITRWRQSDGYIAPSPSCFRFVAIVLSRYRSVVIVFSFLRCFALSLLRVIAPSRLEVKWRYIQNVKGEFIIDFQYNTISYLNTI